MDEKLTLQLAVRERGPGDEREQGEEEGSDGEAGHFNWVGGRRAVVVVERTGVVSFVERVELSSVPMKLKKAS